MSLTLCIQTYRNQIVPALSAARFEMSGGSIGRDSDNVLALDDPDKHISRVQARIDCRDGVYYMTDLGRNPSFINGIPLGHERQTQLQHGDLLTIGAYVVAASVTSEVTAHKAAAPSLQSSFVLPPFLFGSASSVLPLPPLDRFEQDALAAAPILNVDADFNDVLRNAHADPLGVNLFGNGQTALPAQAFPAVEHQHISPETQAFPRVSSDFAAVPLTIPEDYDPLADFFPARLPQSNTPLEPAPIFQGALTQSISNTSISSDCNAIGAHRLTIDAAVRAARLELLDSLNPASIDERWAMPAIMDEMHILHRKATMWDHMKLLYEDIAGRTTDAVERPISEKCDGKDARACEKESENDDVDGRSGHCMTSGMYANF